MSARSKAAPDRAFAALISSTSGALIFLKCSPWPRCSAGSAGQLVARLLADELDEHDARAPAVTITSDVNEVEDSSEGAALHEVAQLDDPAPVLGDALHDGADAGRHLQLDRRNPGAGRRHGRERRRLDARRLRRERNRRRSHGEARRGLIRARLAGRHHPEQALDVASETGHDLAVLLERAAALVVDAGEGPFHVALELHEGLLQLNDLLISVGHK